MILDMWVIDFGISKKVLMYMSCSQSTGYM